MNAMFSGTLQKYIFVLLKGYQKSVKLGRSIACGQHKLINDCPFVCVVLRVKLVLLAPVVLKELKDPVESQALLGHLDPLVLL